MALPPIPIGLQCIDWRYDEQEGKFIPQEITSEVHSVIEIPEYGGKRGFKLFERPLDDGSIQVYKGNSNADKILENRQSRVTSVATGSQYFLAPRVGIVLVPIDTPIGSQYIVQYFGVGSVKNVQNDLYIEQLALAEKLSRDGSLPMLGNLNANLNKIINLAAGTNPNDSVRLSQLTTVINNLAAEVAARTNADNSINGQLGPLVNLIKWVEASVNVRDYANDPNGGPSGKLGMEAYAPRRGTLFWRNTGANISGCGSYGSGSTPFQIIDTGSQFEFRWTSSSNARMEWMLLKW
ncbi:hypothetical protein LIL_50020 (plasmid) [Leptospira interrogans serovar Linhai str. 56609]|uniref:hypothetical protein n=1 Tax=Leptospira interrogans TaxID=173 RepID=UPI0005D77E30|nr:hypothetical protein [Leptospira interrogans]AJR16686.1 hypothetical protein LIL_50020 [Leptospira interrogans serovar Linhai str. 56609]